MSDREMIAAAIAGAVRMGAITLDAQPRFEAWARSRLTAQVLTECRRSAARTSFLNKEEAATIVASGALCDAWRGVRPRPADAGAAGPAEAGAAWPGIADPAVRSEVDRTLAAMQQLQPRRPA